MEEVLQNFNKFTQKSVNFLVVQEDIKDDVKSLVKTLYDFTKSHETVGKKKKKTALPELIVDEFDEEQIWQQIELQNTECWDQLVWEVANCISTKANLEFPVTISSNRQKEERHESDDQPSEDEGSGSDSEPVISEKQLKRKNIASKPKGKPSIVDDKFFKLNDMEQFLLKQEKNEGKIVHDSDEESVDYFEDIDEGEDDEGDDEGGNNVMYSDFFNGTDHQDETLEDEEQHDGEEYDDEPEMSKQTQKTKKKDKKVTFADPSSNEESLNNNENIPEKTMNNNEPKSDFELRQQRLQQTIDRLEQKTLKEAPWQLKGEVIALKRPENSLLEEVVDFDLTSRPPPVITEKTTESLEDIILRRIKDKAWDDVVKKEKPVDDQLSFRKTETLDHSKSKLSLAQVYEAEYLKQKQASSGEVEDEKEPESHTEIRNAMSKLFAQLDALSHYHYTPKPPQAEVKIISNTPAISMEEVAPVATSDAALLAPEEIKKKLKGGLLSKEERTKTDKNRERRKKKKLQRKKGKVEKVTEHRNTKKSVEASDKSLKTSKAFFQQLNDDSTSVIKNKIKGKKSK